VDRCLSHGSYAEIFIARDLAANGQQIIIKALNAFLQGTPDPDLERTLIQNFQNEAIALDKVCHPNIIRRLGHGTASDLEQTPFHYLVLEYMPGGDLLSLCRNRPLDLAQIIAYFEQVSSALSFAHSRQVIHRDVKPNNLLLSGDRRVVKIADFGVARIEASESDEITRVGTNLYAPPEHHPDSDECELRQMLTPSADVYSMAKTIFTAMTGRSPHQFIREPVSSLSDELARQPWGSRLLAILNKATSTEVESRYQSVKEFWDDFSSLGFAGSTDGAIDADPEATLVRSRESSAQSVSNAAVLTASATGSNRLTEILAPYEGGDRPDSTASSAAPAVSLTAGEFSARESGSAHQIPQPVFHPHASGASTDDRPRPTKARIVIPLPERIDRVPEQAPEGASAGAPAIGAVRREVPDAKDGTVTQEALVERRDANAAPGRGRVEATKPMASAAKVGLLDRMRRNTQWHAWVRRMFVVCMILALSGLTAAIYLHFANPGDQRSVVDLIQGSNKDGSIAGAPNVKLRSDPDGDQMGTLPAGTRIRVLEERNNWARIKILSWDGGRPEDTPDTGWVHRRFVKMDQ